MQKLIVMTGLQGAGKSTVAKKIAKEIDATVLSVDPIESAIISAGLEKSFETGLAAYLVARDSAKEQLEIGPVVIDASNYLREAHEMWEQLSAELECELVIVECINSDESLHKERIKNRVRGLEGFDEITWEDVEKRKAETQDWGIDKHVVDTKDDIEPQVEEIIKKMKL